MSVVPDLEFTVNRNKYRASRLSVFQQFNLASDFRDALAGLALLKKDRPKELGEEGLIKAIEFIMTGGAKGLAPEVRDRVVSLCLSVVSRQVASPGVGWTAIQTTDGVLAYQDIQLPELIAIMYHVIDHNGLLDFFFEGPSTSDGQEKEKPGQHSRMAKTG
jgi:Phage tail assembly chaperone protein, TAC